MIPLLIGGAGIGLVALRALLLVQEQQMGRKAENLLHEVAPPTPGAGEGSVSTGPVYRNVFAKDGYPTLDGVKTLYELFATSAKRFAKNPCLGTRKQVRSLRYCDLPSYSLHSASIVF
jgi:hypothetical protein